MGKSTKIICSLLVVTGLIFTGSTSTFSQVLDNTWFEIKVKAKGMVVNPDESVAKGKLNTKAYMHVWWSGEPDNMYIYDIFSEIGEDNWAFTSGDAFGLTTASEEYIFLGDYWFGIAEKSGGFLGIYLTAYFKTILDKKTGELKKATFESFGAEAPGPGDPGSSLDGMNDFYGGVSLKGKLIDESKLPFVLP